MSRRIQEGSDIMNEDKSKKQKKEDHVRRIRENIEMAYLKSIHTKSPDIDLNEEDYDVDIRKEAKEIIDHIKRSKKDIYEIESLQKKPLSSINKRIDDRLDDLFEILTIVMKDKQVELEKLESIVTQLIEDTGPKRDATFLLLHLKRKSLNYIVGHSINVALLSLSIAIEISKIMEKKLENPEVKGDFKKLEICNKKIFSKKEMVKLGVAALLHDLALLDSFPDLRATTQLEKKDISKIEMHPNQAYHMLTRLGADYDVRKAILQHHERADGSGYPDGIMARSFTKYGLVLSFANYIDLLTTKNPFKKKLHPHRAIMHILTRERNRFDADVLFAYCQAASLYPIGSWVLLSNSNIGVVIRSNKSNLKKPVIKCVLSDDMKELTRKEFIDLTHTSITITELVDIESLEMLDEKVNRFIFDEREFTRIKVDITTEINMIDTNIFSKGTIENLSCGGMKLFMNKKFMLGDQFLINFSVNNNHFENIKGLVVWIFSPSNGNFQYGIRFLHMTPEHRQLLIKVTD
ncbi:MAG: PilZ domain-containing protein [Spirochaetes bacterium]|nr:PilZ domain-containing protein [Spirochaetota bacterium]